MVNRYSETLLLDLMHPYQSVHFSSHDFSYTDLRVQFSLFVVNSGCTEGDVRLAGGERVTEGRVEVCQNQTWWAVSGYWYWGLNDATVVCRHLHYPANCE